VRDCFILFLFEIFLLDDFDCEDLSRFSVSDFVDAREGTLPQEFAFGLFANVSVQ